MALLPLHVQWDSLSLAFPPPHQVPPHCHSFLCLDLGKGLLPSLSLFLPWTLQLSSIENNLFWGGSVEGSGLGDRIWDSSCQISFWNRTLETREEKKAQKSPQDSLCPPMIELWPSS
ncbi:unnamed protein product, partial [Gulo gulo]